MEYLLELLKGFLWGRPGQREETLDWERLRQLAAIHGVGGILGYMAMQAPIGPESLAGALRQDCLQTMNLYSRRAELAQQRLAQMADLGIDSCIVKGLVLRSLYPVPELRSFNDTDILIRPRDRQKLHALLLEEGFACRVDWEPVFCYQRGPEYYEVHTQLVDKDVTAQADWRGFFAGVWEHTVPLGPHRYEMEREFHLVYLIAHIAKHVAGPGAGVRMYLDVAVYLKAYGESLDWQRIFAWLETLRLTQFGCAVLTAVESWFDTPCPAAFSRLAPESLARFTQFTLEAGAFGYHGRSAALQAMKQNEGSRPGLLLKRLFPGAGSLEKRYPYLQGKCWLLPVAWVHRALETKGSPRAFAREAKGILTDDRADAQRLKDICKEIGL